MAIYVPRCEVKGPKVFEARRYSAEIQKAAIAAVELRRAQNPKDRTIFREVAKEFDIGEQSLRLWVKKRYRPTKADRSAAAPDIGVAVEAEIEQLRQQVERLKAENALLKQAFVMFSSDWGE